MTNNNQQEKAENSCWESTKDGLGAVLHAIFPLEATAWRASWYPIEELLNTEIDALKRTPEKPKEVSNGMGRDVNPNRALPIAVKGKAIEGVQGKSENLPNGSENAATTGGKVHSGDLDAKEDKVPKFHGGTVKPEEVAAQRTIDERTISWRDKTLEQLNFIGLSSALIGGVIASAISWSILGDLDDSQKTTILALWYSALVLSIGSIGSATQQAVALNRLSTYNNGPLLIRKMMKKTKKVRGRWRVRKWQLLVLQSPILMLSFSIYIFGGALAATIWISTKRKYPSQHTKVVAIFLTISFITTVLYLFSAYGLYRYCEEQCCEGIFCKERMKKKKSAGRARDEETADEASVKAGCCFSQ